jgi:phosphatidylglycerophosphatase A
VSWVDRNIKGGLGIMIDDVVAAGYAAAILYAITLDMGG